MFPPSPVSASRQIYAIWTRSGKSINKYIYLQLLQPFLRQVRCTLTWQVLQPETFLCDSSKYLKHPLQMSGVLEFSVLTRGSKSGVNWDLRLMLKGNFTWKVCWGIGYGYVRQTIVFVLPLTVHKYWLGRPGKLADFVSGANQMHFLVWGYFKCTFRSHYFFSVGNWLSLCLEWISFKTQNAFPLQIF